MESTHGGFARQRVSAAAMGGVWRGFSDLSKVGLICSSVEEGERRMREILKIENGGSPLKCLVLTLSVSGFGSFLDRHRHQPWLPGEVYKRYPTPAVLDSATHLSYL
jgi:hypothetical protein